MSKTESEYINLFGERTAGRPRGSHQRKLPMDDRVLFDRQIYRKAEARALKVLKAWFPDEFDELLVGEYQYLVTVRLQEEQRARVDRTRNRAIKRKSRAKSVSETPKARLNRTARKPRSA